MSHNCLDCRRPSGDGLYCDKCAKCDHGVALSDSCKQCSKESKKNQNG
jgi:hypothetical protein